MEILNAKACIFCNYEVMNHLNKMKGQQTKSQLTTITYQTLKYLESSPCAAQTHDTFKALMEPLKPYNLTRNEKLMLINNPPETPLEIQLMIENSEERLTENEVDEILNIIKKVTGKPKDQEESKVEEEEEETEAT